MKNRLSIISFLLSFTSIAVAVFTNYKIALRYLSSDGKTRALFGLVEYLSFGYRYYFIVPGIAALVIGIMAVRRKELKRLAVAAIAFAGISILVVVFPTWRLFI